MKKRKPRILPIRIYGDKVLRKKASSIEDITPEISEFIEDLKLTMYEKDGVGLAAPQVGKSWRIFVVDPFWYKEGHSKKPYVFINPSFIEFEGLDTAEEGCLSLPEVFEKVTRAEKVIIQGMDEYGKNVKIEADGLFARALQHENDHLDGILFIDHIQKIRKVFIKRKLKELESTTNEKGENIASNE